jgi:hypothetical protein
VAGFLWRWPFLKGNSRPGRLQVTLPLLPAVEFPAALRAAFQSRDLPKARVPHVLEVMVFAGMEALGQRPVVGPDLGDVALCAMEIIVDTVSHWRYIV